MQTAGSIILTGSFVNVGTTYTAVALAGSPGVPRRGYVDRCTITQTGGTGTGARAKMLEPVTGRELFEYDDGTGGVVTFDTGVLDFDTSHVWYDRTTGTLEILIATDDATTDGDVEVVVRIP